MNNATKISTVIILVLLILRENISKSWQLLQTDFWNLKPRFKLVVVAIVAVVVVAAPVVANCAYFTVITFSNINFFT